MKIIVKVKNLSNLSSKKFIYIIRKLEKRDLIKKFIIYNLFIYYLIYLIFFF